MERLSRTLLDGLTYAAKCKKDMEELFNETDSDIEFEAKIDAWKEEYDRDKLMDDSKESEVASNLKKNITSASTRTRLKRTNPEPIGARNKVQVAESSREKE
jgi:hypothetical protein